MIRRAGLFGVLLLAVLLGAAPVSASGRVGVHSTQADQLSGTLAFERYHTPANSETYGMYSYIVSMAADGSTEQVLTTADTIEERVPSWSNDGSKLAYTGGPDWDLYTVNSDGSGTKQLTSGSNLGDWWPSWSPDGKRMAFYRTDYERGGTRLYSIKADGSGLRPLTDGSWTDATAAWSPDGKWIAFSRYDPSGDPLAGYHIWAVKPDGSGLHRLTRGRLQTWRPAWSPDGKWLAFGGWYSEDYEGDVVSSRGHIYVVPARGGKRRQVTSGDIYDMEPCWSPDSKRIAFTRTLADVWIDPPVWPSPLGNYLWPAYSVPADIYSVKFDGSDLRQITSTPVSEEGCTWTR